MSTVKVTIGLSESPHIERGEFDSINAASLYLGSKCQYAPAGGAYHKTDVVVQITALSGNVHTYPFQLDLTEKLASADIRETIRSRCRWVIENAGKHPYCDVGEKPAAEWWLLAVTQVN